MPAILAFVLKLCTAFGTNQILPLNGASAFPTFSVLHQLALLEGEIKILLITI